MDPTALRAYFAEHFPQALTFGEFEILAVDAEGSEIALETGPEHLRPGGTVSGPTLMTLADTAMYTAILGRLGLSAWKGVTSSLEMHFLARPDPGRLLVRCRLLKVGRRLAVGAVDLHGADGTRVAFATVTYALG